MKTIAACALLVLLGYILWGQYKTRKQAHEVEMRARRRRMEVERDAWICREIERLPLSEVDE